MLYFILIPTFIVLGLVGYLFYIDYKSNILFRGETFKESRFSRKIIDFFMPKPQKAAKIDSDLFYLTHTKTVRDFTMMKVIILFISIIFSALVVVTNVINAKESVYTRERVIPVKVSKHDYEVLVDRLTFQEIDYRTDLSRLNSNVTRTEKPSVYLNMDSELLYDTVKTMKIELESAFGFGSILTFFGIIAAAWFLPNVILKMLDGMLGKDIHFEFSRLESYIYMNADKPVEVIIRGLSYEAVIFRAPFIEFLARYREDSEYSYDLVLSTRGANMKFKRLIEYLKLLDNTSPRKAREKIAVHQANNQQIVRNLYRASIEKKKGLCKFLIYVAIFINIIAIAVGIGTGIMQSAGGVF